jgi:hypothetical protein
LLRLVGCRSSAGFRGPYAEPGIRMRTAKHSNSV